MLKNVVTCVVEKRAFSLQEKKKKTVETPDESHDPEERDVADKKDNNTQHGSKVSISL